jgi:hypothetical protein
MKFTKTIFKTLLALVAWGFALHAHAQPASCSAPGKDGTTYSAPSYYPGNASVAAGATNISLGTIRGAGGTNLPAGSGTPGTTAIAPGDLVMIIQMQDASYNNGDSVAYGNGSTGRGWTNINNAGSYEFRRAVSFNGANLVVDQPLSFAYTRANPSGGNGAAENGNRRFQVIRVPQFSNVTLPGGTIAPPAWDGETGGVFVMDVAGTLNMNGTTINASAMGFRGGGAWPTYPIVGSNITAYVNTRTFNITTNAYCSTNYDTLTASFTATTYPNIGGAKGEGIAGTPRLVRRQATTNSGTYETPFAYQDLNVVGYANGGFLARGAPGNAGGGGTQHNSGGGGGSNVGQGGSGGNTFALYRNPPTGTCVNFGGTFNACDGDLARAVGGLGGGTLAASIDRVIMGGGGGAGDANNNCDNPALPQTAGGNGGGIIFLRAGAIAGAGTLTANGQNGLPGGRDSAGGGGAGGSVVVLTATNNPALTIQAKAVTRVTPARVVCRALCCARAKPKGPPAAAAAAQWCARPTFLQPVALPQCPLRVALRVPTFPWAPPRPYSTLTARARAAVRQLRCPLCPPHPLLRPIVCRSWRSANPPPRQRSPYRRVTPRSTSFRSPTVAQAPPWA